MAGSPVATINAQLALDTAQFDSGLAKAPAKARIAAKEIEGAFGSNLFGEGFGKAITKVFDSSKLSILDEGAAHINVFGRALEPLGAVGIAAAAGLAAVGFAAEQARRAMEWGEELEKTSKALGTTTTYVQEFDHAAAASGISVATGREALKSFNEVLGKYSTGLASGKQAKWFDALGFTPAAARQVGAIDAALDLTLRKLANVSNPSQRAGFAQQFGLSAFLPLLAEGEEGIDRFETKMKEAYANGEVLRPDQVSKLGALNEKLGEVSDKIETDFRTAFIDLAPSILKVAEYLERAAKASSNFVANIPHVARGVEDFQATHKGPAGVLGTGVEQKTLQVEGNILAFPWKMAAKGYEYLAQRGKVSEMNAAIQAGLKSGVDMKGLAKAKSGADYKPAAREGGASRRDAARDAQHLAEVRLEQAKKTTAAVAAAQERELAAEDNSSRSIDERYGFELARTQIARTARDKELAEQVDLFKTSGGLKGLSAAQARQVAAANAMADSAEDSSRSVQNAYDIQDEAIRQQGELVALNDQQISDQESLAKTAAARRALALRVYDAERAQARVVLSRDLDRNPNLTPADREARLGQFDQNTGSGREVVAKNSLSPLEAWRDKSLQTAGQIKEAYESVAVDGLNSLTDGLTGVIGGTKSAGDAFHDMAQSIIADLVRIAVQRSITQPLEQLLFGGGSNTAPANLIGMGGLGQSGGGGGGIGAAVSGLFSLLPHFDKGGSFTVGGSGGMDGNLTSLMLGRGERVDITRPDQMRDAGGGVTFVLNSPVVTQDLLDQMQAMADGAEARATINGSTLGSANAQAAAQRSASRRLGR